MTVEVGPVLEDVVQRAGLVALQHIIGDADLLRYPRRPNGSPMLLRQSFFERLLRGEVQLVSLPAADILAAQPDIRYLGLSQLLRLRCDCIDRSASMPAISLFVSSLDDHIEKQLVARLVASGGVEIEPSQASTVVRLVLLVYGARQRLISGGDGEKSRWWLIRCGGLEARLDLEACKFTGLHSDDGEATLIYCHRNLSRTSVAVPKARRQLHWEVELSESPAEFNSAPPSRRPPRTCPTTSRTEQVAVAGQEVRAAQSAASTVAAEPGVSTPVAVALEATTSRLEEVAVAGQDVGVAQCEVLAAVAELAAATPAAVEAATSHPEEVAVAGHEVGAAHCEVFAAVAEPAAANPAAVKATTSRPEEAAVVGQEVGAIKCEVPAMVVEPAAATLAATEDQEDEEEEKGLEEALLPVGDIVVGEVALAPGTDVVSREVACAFSANVVTGEEAAMQEEALAPAAEVADMEELSCGAGGASAALPFTPRMQALGSGWTGASPPNGGTCSVLSGTLSTCSSPRGIAGGSAEETVLGHCGDGNAELLVRLAASEAARSRLEEELGQLRGSAAQAEAERQALLTWRASLAAWWEAAEVAGAQGFAPPLPPVPRAAEAACQAVSLEAPESWGQKGVQQEDKDEEEDADKNQDDDGLGSEAAFDDGLEEPALSQPLGTSFLLNCSKLSRQEARGAEALLKKSSKWLRLPKSLKPAGTKRMWGAMKQGSSFKPSLSQ
mmetsp:Transcript_48599/g.104128  ORF Transcript_48599/g.104128 Transcript_48599/m.104128 type:complete len:726 (-) Transcript_48599:72-2249(-)